MKPTIGVVALALLVLAGCSATTDDAAPRVSAPSIVTVVPESIDGEWVAKDPGDFTPNTAVLVLRDGTWSWDGCHPGQGTFELDDAGRLLSDGGPSSFTMQYCGPELGMTVLWAASAKMVDDDLVLVDVDGRELVTLVRA